MKKRALVVGSQTGGLEGAIGDAERMAQALADRQFEIELCTTDATASRDGILAGYRRLIEQTHAGDAAVFYYSGHGVRVLPSADSARAIPVARPLQAIVPTDFESSSENDFHGITDIELSVLLAKLTRRTDNATVILDCCHAAAMSRDVEARPKSLFRPCYVDLENHVARVTAQGLEVDLLTAASDTLAVRLIAAGQSQSAYERYVETTAVGTFTESLVLALNEASDEPVTWDSIIRSVRERVLGIHPAQRADIEGPRRRYVFDTTEAPRAAAVAVVAGKHPAEAVLRAGRLHGVHEADEYAIVANGTADPAGRIATAKVTHIDTGASTATVRFVPPLTELPAGAQAIPLTSAARKRVVQVVADDPVRATVIAAIEATGRFTVTAQPGATPLLASVKVHGGQIELLSAAGVPVVPPTALSDANIDWLAVNLRMLIAAQALRELGSDGDQLPGGAAEVTWGRVEAGNAIALAPAGELLSIGARIFVRVTNRHPRNAKLYAHVFDIGVAQRIRVLTADWPAGFELEPGETFTLGEAVDGKLEGLDLAWSSQLPEDVVRTESLVVIVTEQPSDLTALETPAATADWSARATRSVAGSPLQQLVTQVQYGTPRDARPIAQPHDRYLVRHISFELSPWPLPAKQAEFLIDDRPPGSAQLFTPRGVARTQRTLELRIAELAVHDAGSWSGSPELRLDTLVVTRSPASTDQAYRAETLRFKQIADGELQPISNALLYHGTARDFLDFRVWVSRDRDGSKTLAELLEDQASSAELTEAATALLAVTGSSAAPIVAAVGASRTLATIAWNALSSALPGSIGLYQTSLLAGEGAGFGQGRHPRSGMFRAPGFSFSYEVALTDEP